jgi:PAS domain S-box-containing protein
VRVLMSSAAALAVPLLFALFLPDALGEYRPALWMLALIPVMRLGYWRGWRGATVASVLGVAAFVLVEIVVAPGEGALRDPRMAPTVLAFFAAICLGIIVLAKRFGDVIDEYRRGELLRRLEKAVQTMHLGVTVSDAEGRITYVNRADAAQHGYAVEELVGQSSSIYAPPEHRRPIGPRDLSGISSWRRERTDARKDGTLIPVELHSDIVIGVDGKPIGVVTVCEDISEMKRVAREAERMAERERSLQEQLNQAQKMQAVGRLAGGVAHDFNNILTVILAEAEIGMTDLPDAPAAGSPEGHTLKASFQEILKAGRRATGLTRQLLAFSRKQTVDPTVFDLNDLLVEMEKMLRRLVGEDVEVVIRAAASPAWVEADRGQIEQVVMNLVVNARDAMPQGGRLVLETANATLDEDYASLHPDVVPGPHVALAVSDSGTGMSEEVKAHIFEPFFTTKGEGKGTGLGLATSYGIVAQAGGHVGVESRLGAGTTMRVLLPLAGAPVSGEQARAQETARAKGSETILLVEDDEGVRETVARVLQAAGYRVLEAGDPEQALRVLAEHRAPLHLLLTDVVLPRMSGRVLAERIHALRPETRVLYVSGYTDDVMAEHRMLDRGLALLRKPFSPSVLAAKVRQVIDGPISPSGA